MTNVISKILPTFFLGLFLFVAPVVFANHIPSPTGYVNDFAGVLSQEQKTTLDNSLKEYEKKTRNEIAVAFVQSLSGGDIDDFTIRAFEEWKIGKKNQDNGILFLAAIEDRKMRIEVGYGLEPLLTDGEAGEIIRDIIAPEFKQSRYYDGATKGIDIIEKQLAGEDNIPQEDFSITSLIKKIWDDIELVFYGLIIIWLLGSFLVYLSSFLARSKSIWLGGLIGGGLGSLIGVVAGRWTVAVASIVILGLLGLLLDWLLSRTYKKLKEGRHQTDWWHTGGGFWGSKGSGVGFGGFGGGSSGGGGASGSW